MAFASIVCGIVLVGLVMAGVVLWWAGSLTIIRDPMQGSATGTDRLYPASGPSDEETPPAWVPIYPHSKSLHARVPEGTFQFETEDPPDNVIQFYQAKLHTDAFELTVDRKATRSAASAEISASKDEGKRKIHVSIQQSKGPTSVTVIYSETGDLHGVPVGKP